MTRRHDVSRYTVQPVEELVPVSALPRRHLQDELCRAIDALDLVDSVEGSQVVDDWRDGTLKGAPLALNGDILVSQLLAEIRNREGSQADQIAGLKKALSSLLDMCDSRALMNLLGEMQWDRQPNTSAILRLSGNAQARLNSGKTKDGEIVGFNEDGSIATWSSKRNCVVPDPKRRDFREIRELHVLLGCISDMSYNELLNLNLVQGELREELHNAILAYQEWRKAQEVVELFFPRECRHMIAEAFSTAIGNAESRWGEMPQDEKAKYLNHAIVIAFEGLPDLMLFLSEKGSHAAMQFIENASRFPG